MLRYKFITVLAVIALSIIKVNCQDVNFSQWEGISNYTNPSLTGDFDGSFRFQAKFRNQFASILGSNSYKTGIASVEYKFRNEKLRKLSLGFYSLFDRAGQSQFTANSYILSTSVIQNLGDINSNHHEIGIGFGFGLGSRSVIFSTPPWLPGTPTNTKLRNHFGDLSLGLNLKYISNSNFNFKLGGSINHLNRPDVSIFDTGNERLAIRYNVHGIVEIPITNKVSLMPTILYDYQLIWDHIIFGIYSKWYINSSDSNNLQIGFLLRAIDELDENKINAYVISTKLELNSLLIGLSYDQFTLLGSNAFELSIGYIINGKLKQ